MKTNEEAEYTVCPFCKETDFDLVGLKVHLTFYCEEFINYPLDYGKETKGKGSP